MKPKRIAKIGVVAVLLTALGAVGTWWFLKNERSLSRNSLTLYGNIDMRDAQLAFNEQERIDQVLVEEGERVSAGQVLARLQTDRLQARIRETEAQVAAQQQIVDKLVAGMRPQEIAQARAEVAAVQVQVQNAEQNLQRIRQTAGSGATSEQALDDATAHLAVDRAQLQVKEKALNLALEGPRKEDVAAAKAQWQALNASLALLQIRLGDAALKAPSTGIIQNRILEPGEMAGPASPVFTLALTDPKWVRAYVPEPDLGRIQRGMKARVQSDSFADQTFEGWVGFISPEAEFTPKSVETEDLRTKLVYEVRVFVKDPQDVLRLGMPVTVTVDRGSVADKSARGGAPADRAAQPEGT